MSLKPEYRICTICGKRYSFNPDAGKMECPRCGKKKKGFIEIMVRDKNKNS